MVTREQQPLQIRDGQGNTRSGEVNYLLYDAAERNKRAFKMLALCWGLAVVSIFIIILHWVLVPGLLIAGPIMAVRKHKVTREIESARGTCPACQQDVTFKMEVDETLPKNSYCPQCNAPIQLAPAVAP